MHRTANLSGDGVYRYRLMRSWGTSQAHPIVWVMLNPSTADATTDDSTIRRVIGFTKSLGYESFVVVNLFALRATKPKQLITHSDPVGPENDAFLRQAFAFAPLVICAWGNGGQLFGRDLEVRQIIRQFHHGHPVCLGHGVIGQPKHPLYLPANTSLVPLSEVPRALVSA